jgi:hypothetical protein
MRKIRNTAQDDKALKNSWQLKEAQAFANWKMQSYEGEFEHREAMYRLYVERYLYNLGRDYVYEQTQFAIKVMSITHKVKKIFRIN